MKRERTIVLTMLLVLLLGMTALAGNTATQTVSITVAAVNVISVSSDTVNITIDGSGVSAGDLTFTATDDSTTMSFTTNEASKKITAQLSQDYTDITLQVNVATTNGSSQGAKTLSSAAAVDVLIFNKLSESGNQITYTASCGFDKSPAAAESAVVTFTILDA